MADKYVKVVCPECGCTDFEGLFNTFDQVTYQCWVYEDGTYDMVHSLKDFVGESELASNDFRCMECNHTIVLNQIQPDEDKCEDIWDE
jgi:hypothetical protein